MLKFSLMVVFYTCTNNCYNHIYFLFYFKLPRIKTSFQSIGEYCDVSHIKREIFYSLTVRC